jgi:hypothetical protein
LLYAVLFPYSCSEDEIVDKSTQLKIEGIPIVDQKFSFLDKKQFIEVVNDFYKHYNEYENYLVKINFNCNLVLKEKFKDLVRDDMSFSELKLLIDKHNLLINSNKETEMKFSLSVFNALFNVNGEVLVNGQVLKLDEHKGLFQDNKLESRGQNHCCSTTETWDRSFSCADRRFKGEVKTQFSGFFFASWDPFQDCGVEYLAEAKSTWFKKVGGIWVHKDADDLYVGSNHSAFNNRANANNIVETGGLEANSINEDEAITGLFFWVGASSSGTCNGLTSSNHGVYGASSSHGGNESGSCGSISALSLSISNCP